MKKLPTEVKQVWLIRAVILFLIEALILVALGIGAYVYSWPEWILEILALIFVAILVVKLVLIPYNYAFHQYGIFDDRVEIQAGFIFRSQDAIPIARVQNVNLNQGPILIHKHLYEISIDTSSDSHTIEAVTYEEAKLIRNKVMELAMEARNAR